MENSRRFLTVGCVAISLLLLGLAVVIGGAIYASRIPEVTEQVPPNAAPILITISNPPNYSSWPRDTFVPVFSIAKSERSIVSLALWVDGAVVQTAVPAEPGPTHVYTRWTWAPGTEGEHSLVVRVTDAEGQVGTSNVVHVVATEAVGYDIIHTAEEGDTPETLAQEYDTPVEDITSQNPGLDPGSPIPPGEMVFIPRVPLPVSPPEAQAPPAMPEGPVQPVVESPSGKLPIWIEKNLGGTQTLPAAPELSYGITGCRVDLVLVDKSENEDGFFVYRADLGSTAFKRIATLGANDGALPLMYSDGEGGSHREYYVAAFNGAGETQSNLVSVDLTDPACSPIAPGSLHLIGERLFLPKPVDAVYAYVSVNNSSVWTRVPPDPNAFLTPEGDSVDLGPYIDAQLRPIGQLALEAWGWTGGSLENLGTAQTMDATLEGDTQLIVCKLGASCPPDHTSTAWGTEDTVGSEGDYVPYRGFYWQTNLPGVTGALWQIALSPFSAEFNLDPPDLVDSGQQQGAPEGFFQADFGELSTTVLDGELPNIPSPKVPPLTYYVRLIPMAGSQPAGEPSNVVTIHYQPLGPAPTAERNELPDIYNIQIIYFEDEQYMDPNVWGCVVVQENYFLAINPIHMFGGGGPHYDPSDPDCFDPTKATCWALEPGWGGERMTFDKTLFFLAGQTLCPTKISAPSELEALLKGIGGMLKDAWDATVEGVNWTKGQIVSAAIGGIEEVFGVECSGICADVVETGIDLAITYFTGIPPELPSSEDLLNVSVDYAVELVMSEMGADCSSLEDMGLDCKALIREGLKAAYEASVLTSSNQACASAETAAQYGVEPMCLPPDLKRIPYPRSTYQPATAEVRVLRVLDEAHPPHEGENEFYAVRVKVEGINEAVVGNYFYAGANDAGGRCVRPYGHPYEEPLAGTLYQTQILPIPYLETIEQTHIPVVFDQYPYEIPGHIDCLAQLGLCYGGTAEKVMQYDRYCLKTGGKIVVTAELMCKGDFMGEWEPCYDSVYTELPVPGNLCHGFVPPSYFGK
jgi:LysM repeat protein